MDNLQDQFIIITGGAVGIEGAMSTEFIKHRTSIVTVDLNEKAGYIKEKFNLDKEVFVKEYSFKKSFVEELVQLAISKFKELTSVVNNTYALCKKPLLKHTKNDWEISLNTSFKEQKNLRNYIVINKTISTLILFLFAVNFMFAQVGTNGDNRDEEGRPITEYNLVIEQNKMTLAGVTADGMTVNGDIPAPTLEFAIGDLAVINVTNKMDVETSVHWHGIIVPNFYDGVPYLTTPPIKPNTTF
ncbi:short subunit dehydrogenase [Balneicella halophila]|uniref:Short subunit dehydrogenase n=1 Tax=Balneicella halophila TaxID=1537566 RepID=A0A7L4UNH5_BALHA|nr:short subunit dehydrogenase [Balneicella halophila]